MCCGNKGPAIFTRGTRCLPFSKRSGWICPDSTWTNSDESGEPGDLSDSADLAVAGYVSPHRVVRLRAASGVSVMSRHPFASDVARQPTVDQCWH